MNLDQLVQSIPDDESVLRNGLAHWVAEWKQSDDSIEVLENLISKWHGNVWFTEDSVSNEFYQNWCNFKKHAITDVSGMTMNERLYIFCLSEQWDSGDEKTKMLLRKKLKAEVR